jgi:DNA-binding CsgD family transcriptional regulator
MPSHRRTLSLVRHVYTAAADPTHWPDVLEHLADEYRGGVAGFQYRTGTEGRIQSARFVRFDPALHDVYRGYFATRNPWTRLSQPFYRTGFIYTPDRMLPLAALQRTEFYDGILRPSGVVHCFGACVFREGDDVLSFTVVRSRIQGPYHESELKRVEPILPHLHRAMQINRRLSQLQRTHAALADGLEHLRHGVINIDGRGRVVFANRAARTIVDQQDGLSLTPGGLVASTFSERLRLRALLDSAVRTTSGQGFGAGGAMTVTRPSLKRAFLVLVTPLRLALEDDHPSGMATVFISDPETRVETIEEAARRLYGLTEGEARVARAFAATGNVDRVTEQLGISRETVRWHLRHLYGKTGTHRQSALLKRLVGGPSLIASSTGSTGGQAHADV